MQPHRSAAPPPHKLTSSTSCRRSGQTLQENRLGQKFVVDATLLTDLSHAGKSDDLRRTVNYAQVYE